MRSSFYVFFSLCFTFQNLSALPTDEVFCGRVFSGLRWQREKCFGNISEEDFPYIKPILKQIIQKERELKEDYYQVITAQDSLFLAYQTILKELYRCKYLENFDEFEFLRAFLDPKLVSNLDCFFSNHPDLADVTRIMKEWKELVGEDDDQASASFWTTYENDTQPKISTQLISASLTLETNAPLDSALHVFAQGGGMSTKTSDNLLGYLIRAFKFEGFLEEEVQTMLTYLLEQAPKSKEGILLQIFVPKYKMTRVGYISSACGFLRRGETENIHAFFSEHEQRRDSSDFDTNKNDQVRLLAGTLDPNSIKIFRYTTIDEACTKQYKGLVRARLKDLFASIKTCNQAALK